MHEGIGEDEWQTGLDVWDEQAQLDAVRAKQKCNHCLKPGHTPEMCILKHLGGGQPPSLPWHAQPQTHEIQDANSNLGISKVFWDPCLGHDTIWRPGQEMKVYVDNNKHVDK